MEAGNEHVHVERKTTIGSLNEVALGHPFDFASQEFLLFITPQVFDQGVAEHNIKGAIGKGNRVASASTQRTLSCRGGFCGIPRFTIVRSGSTSAYVQSWAVPPKSSTFVSLDILNSRKNSHIRRRRKWLNCQLSNDTIPLQNFGQN